MSNKRPRIYAHCDAGCKWEVPHKTDIPYYENLCKTTSNGLIAGTKVEIGEVNIPLSDLLGETLRLTVEIVAEVSAYGGYYTVFVICDENYYRSYIPLGTGSAIVDVFFDGSAETSTKVSITLQAPSDHIMRVKELAVCRLGQPVFAMTGANDATAGKTGAVPAPMAGDQDKVLHGDGSWREPSAITDYVETLDTPVTVEIGLAGYVDNLYTGASTESISLPVGEVVRIITDDGTLGGVVQQTTINGYEYNYVGCVNLDYLYGYDNTIETGLCGIAVAKTQGDPDTYNGASLLVFWWGIPVEGSPTLNLTISSIGQAVKFGYKEYVDKAITGAMTASY